MGRYKDKSGIDFFQLLTGLLLMAVSVWLLSIGNRFGWVGLAFGLLGVAHVAHQFRVQRRLRRSKAERRAMLLETSFTPALDDDVEIWQRLLATVESSWVLFENGSLVLCGTSSEPEALALQVTEQYEHVTPGTASGDFSIRLYADAGVWVVSLAAGRVLSLVRLEECEQETAAGMLARGALEDDARQKRIVHVHPHEKPSEGTPPSG